MANRSYDSEFYDKAARAAVTSTLISKKANVCPFAVRLAWHASGTYDATDGTGGPNTGATMRWAPERDDPANAGLTIMHDLLLPLLAKFPHLSTADLWCMAATQAIALTRGPTIPFHYGRKKDVSNQDGTSSSSCPPHGRLPDASQGAQHLRDVFYRMGFDDQAIVALSGAHTLGSCHATRSGYEGPWTTNPLKFDNEYFRNLLHITWKPREWDGPLQYTDPTGHLIMLPTDLALIEDKQFLPYVKAYANDEQLFFKDFAEAFGKLLALGCPAHVQPDTKKPKAVVKSPETQLDKDFRDLAMHGNLTKMKEIVATAAENGGVNFHSHEAGSGRTPLHKAAFFGHAHVVSYLVHETALSEDDINLQDADGDTPLHDAAKLGHVDCVRALLNAGASTQLVNLDGRTARDLAAAHHKHDVVALLDQAAKRQLSTKDCVGCFIL